MDKQPWWTPTKSTTLSIVVTWIALIAAVACLPLMPFLPRLVPEPGTLLFDEEWLRSALVALYACLVAGIIALILLLRLLTDISKGEVFTEANVNRLKAISYCGFAIMVVCAVASAVTRAQFVFLMLAVAAGFLGLLMRVVKNVIDTARELKEESDYTI